MNNWIDFYIQIGHKKIAVMLIENDASFDFDVGKWKAVIFHCVADSGIVNKFHDL